MWLKCDFWISGEQIYIWPMAGVMCLLPARVTIIFATQELSLLAAGTMTIAARPRALPEHGQIRNGVSLRYVEANQSVEIDITVYIYRERALDLLLSRYFFLKNLRDRRRSWKPSQ